MVVHETQNEACREGSDLLHGAAPNSGSNWGDVFLHELLAEPLCLQPCFQRLIPQGLFRQCFTSRTFEPQDLKEPPPASRVHDIRPSWKERFRGPLKVLNTGDASCCNRQRHVGLNGIHAKLVEQLREQWIIAQVENLEANINALLLGACSNGVSMSSGALFSLTKHHLEMISEHVGCCISSNTRSNNADSRLVSSMLLRSRCTLSHFHFGRTSGQSVGPRAVAHGLFCSGGSRAGATVGNRYMAFWSCLCKCCDWDWDLPSQSKMLSM
mmetsp:Transcript_28024/g.57876  ORF Transcript_28024/g.57876 Transcript_28024/m.57876 type:complete len:269 (+) Transcript_28024:87-893(+)